MSLKSQLANIFFPARCVFCDEAMDYRTLYCICDACNIEIKSYYTAEGCFLFLDKIRSAVLRMKFAKATDYARTFGLTMAAQLKLRLDKIDFDVAVPVPLSKKRFEKRGYNQSALLAKVVAKELNIDFDERSLIKIKETEIQSKLHERERAKNLKGAFAIKGDNLRGKRVLLIDDVRTTGATLDECTNTLLKKGKAKSVFPWVFARVDT